MRWCLLLVLACEGEPMQGSRGTAGTFDPRTWTPGAKGLWIWRFDYIGKSAEEVATIAHAAGVGFVLIKSGQDDSFWSTRYSADNVAQFTSRGMRVFAWPYITLENIDGSIAAAVQAAKTPGTDGLVLDVEVEWKVAGSDAEAVRLCDGIRAGAPGVFLGYTSFGWVNFHPDFPFQAFDEHCGDVFIPQVYWSNRGTSWALGYEQAREHLAQANLHAPVWLAQSNDRIYKGGEPTTADLNAFFAVAGPHTSLWMFPSEGNDAKVSQLSDLNWSNE